MVAPPRRIVRTRRPRGRPRPPQPGRGGDRAAAVPCAPGRRPAPFGDPGVVTGPQHLGHRPSPELRRPGVLRVLEQPVGEGLLHRGCVVAHDPGQQAGHRLDDQERAGLAAGEHDVADGDLAVAEVVGDALVDAFVPAAQQGEAVTGGQLAGHRLVEPSAAGGEQQQRTRRVRRLHGREDRLRPHHHPGPTAERRVVDGAVAVVGVVARIVQPQVDHTPLPGAADEREVERPGEVVGEDREDVDAHASLGSVPQPGGEIDGDESRRVLDDERQRDEALAVEDQQVARRIRLDRLHHTERGAVTVLHRRADQLVHPQLVASRWAARRRRA